MKTLYSVTFFCLIVFFFTSCLKNEDDTANGPKANLALVNLVVQGSGVEMLVDNQLLTPAPVTYGTNSSLAGSIYLPFAAGIRSLTLRYGTTDVLNKNQFFAANAHQTWFLFDSAHKQQLFMTDDARETLDTMARARFLHFIPGNDTLTTLLLKGTDTLRLATSQAYVGANSAAMSGAFNAFKPGTYQLKLYTSAQLRANTAALYVKDSVIISARHSYTFIAKGTPGGTGNYTPQVMLLQNN